MATTKMTAEELAKYQQQIAQENAQKQQQMQQQISQARQMQSAPTPANGQTVQQPAQTDYTNLAGISDQSRAQLQYYGQGYQPSATVQAAQQYLADTLAKQPGQYQSSYAGQIEQLYNQIMGRPKFTYDVNKDPLFQTYKDQYMVNGQRAMQDTIGNAAALTGGYGNSWGTTAGYQAYQQYLQALNGIIPDLEQRAFDRYGAEGDQMRENLNMAMTLDQTDYGRYRDTVGDWQQDRSYARGAYDTEADRDRSDWYTMMQYYLNQAQLENSDFWNEMSMLYGNSGGSGSGGGITLDDGMQNTGTGEDKKYYIQGQPYEGDGPASKELRQGLYGALTKSQAESIQARNKELSAAGVTPDDNHMQMNKKLNDYQRYSQAMQALENANNNVSSLKFGVNTAEEAQKARADQIAAQQNAKAAQQNVVQNRTGLNTVQRAMTVAPAANNSGSASGQQKSASYQKYYNIGMQKFGNEEKAKEYAEMALAAGMQ